MGPVVIIRALDQNHRRRWVFEWRGRDVVLKRYHLERQETDGSFRLVEFFDAEDDVRGYGTWKWLTESRVPWDDELKGEVALAIIDKLRIRRLGEIDTSIPAERIELR